MNTSSCNPEIAILLHVEVNELGDLGAVGTLEALLCRGAVEQLHAIAQHLHREPP